MPDPSLNMVLRNVGSLNTGLRSVMTLGLSLRHIAYIPDGSNISFGFDDVAVTGFTLSIVPSANIVAFGFESVDVTGFDLAIDTGSNVIAFGFESVDVTGFDLAIDVGSNVIAFGFESVDVTGFSFTLTEGEQIAFGFEDVTVTGFTLSVSSTANTISLGFDDVTVTGFALTIEEGSGIPTTLKNTLVVAFEWEDNYTELHAGYSTTAINTPPFQNSINGRGIIMRASTSIREVRVNTPGWEALRPLLTDFTIFCHARWQKVDDTQNTHVIYNHKGSSAASSGIKCYYRRDLERFHMEIANGTTRITLVSNVYAQTTFDDNFVPLLFEWDRDGHMKGEITGVDFGDRDNTSLISSQVADSIGHTNVAQWGGGDIGLDNCYAWKRLLTAEEKTALNTLNLGYSDLP